MPMGKMWTVAPGQKLAFKKKPALSNKQLTRAVRALKATEGERSLVGQELYAAVTLTAGTADINYLGSFPWTTSATPSICHYTNFYCKFLTTGATGATLRIMVCYDEHYDGTDLGITEILFTPGTDSTERYNNNTRTIKEARHKNADVDARCVVVYDKLIPLIANEPKTLQFRVNHYNRKITDSGTDDYLNFNPFMMLLADEANVTATVSHQTMYTDLSE